MHIFKYGFMACPFDGCFVEENIKFMLSGEGENNELQQLSKLRQGKRIVMLMEV